MKAKMPKTRISEASAARLRRQFNRGARAAADFASEYDGVTAHDRRIGDCVLSKMNLRERPPRRNRRRMESPDRAFLRGLAVGVAGMHRLGEDNRGARQVVRDAATSLDAMRAAGVSQFDLRQLRRAGVR